MGICSHNLFSVEFEDQPQHAMGSWMLRTEVDSIMANLPRLIFVAEICIWSFIHTLWVIFVDMLGESGVGRHQSSFEM